MNDARGDATERRAITGSNVRAIAAHRRNVAGGYVPVPGYESFLVLTVAPYVFVSQEQSPTQENDTQTDAAER